MKRTVLAAVPFIALAALVGMLLASTAGNGLTLP